MCFCVSVSLSMSVCIERKGLALERVIVFVSVCVLYLSVYEKKATIRVVPTDSFFFSVCLFMSMALFLCVFVFVSVCLDVCVFL